VLVIRVLADQDEDRPEGRHALDPVSGRSRQCSDGCRQGQSEE
jgi:hypothetical protein